MLVVVRRLINKNNCFTAKRSAIFKIQYSNQHKLTQYNEPYYTAVNELKQQSNNQKITILIQIPKQFGDDQGFQSQFQLS